MIQQQLQEMQIEQQIPEPEITIHAAEKKYGISSTVFETAIECGVIQAIQKPFATENRTKTLINCSDIESNLELLRRGSAFLRQQKLQQELGEDGVNLISLPQAEKQFKISSTVFHMAAKCGFLTMHKVPYGKMTKNLLEVKQIEDNLKILKMGGHFIRTFLKNKMVIIEPEYEGIIEIVKPEPKQFSPMLMDAPCVGCHKDKGCDARICSEFDSWCRGSY